jgi:hypothetical protein
VVLTRYTRPMRGRGLAVVGAVVLGAVAMLLGASQGRAAASPLCAPWQVRTVATGLGVLENLEPDGQGGLLISDALVSRDSPGWSITRVPFADPAHPQRNWSRRTTRMAWPLTPTGTWLYFDQTFQPGGLVLRARLSDPGDVEQVASLGQGLALDDLTIDRAGDLYIAATCDATAP